MGPVVNIVRSPFDCNPLNDPAEILGSIEIVFPPLTILSAPPVPCGAESVIDINELTAEFADITTLLVIVLPLFTLPVADINPAVLIFPPCILPVAVTRPAVEIFPPITFAAEVIVLVAEINPAVNKLPPVTLPVAVTKPAVEIFPPITFAAEVIVLVAEINPAVRILPPVMLPVAVTRPAVEIFPPITLAADVIVEVADINPAVNMLPPVILPLAETSPVTYSPVGANTATLPTPLTDIVTLAAAAEILTLLLPFVRFDTLAVIPVN